MQSQPEIYAAPGEGLDKSRQTPVRAENNTIVIVDCGIGNLGSIRNMFRKIGYTVTISGKSEDILAADKLILPGVGHFDAGMRRIHESGLLPALNKRAKEDRIPILGICLGMQLLFEGSDEGSEQGLGWIPGRCRKFSKDLGYKVPHMGWNIVRNTAACPLFDDLGETARFYFAHSYHTSADDAAVVAATADYGIEFTAAVQQDKLFGVQFHPEKSHRFGMTVLGNFARL